MTSYWAVAQTVSKMEHIVRREIEKTNHGTFLPTCARFWKVDGREYARERPVIGGYVFFLTDGEDWAGIPDIHGVYRVLPSRVLDHEMKRMVIGHAAGEHNETIAPRYTRYYRAPESYRRKSRKPRASKRIRNSAVA